MSQTAYADDLPDAWTAPRPAVARPNILLASLAVAAVTLGLTGASLAYAFTHIPEVDPNAEAAPVAEVAAIAAQAPETPAKLDVLPPPVYGAGVTNQAPAFVPLSARVHMDTSTIDAVDPYKLSEADGITRPCGDPCAAQAGYVAPEADAEARPATARASTTVQDDDDDGNAPPPPDMTIN